MGVRGRLLVADDSSTVVEMLKALLAEQGHEVFTASDGIMAAEAVFQYMPDLVISDVTMPRMNGYQLCRLLKNDPVTAHIPVMLLTSHDQARDRFWGTESGADEYLVKDGGIGRLAEVVSMLLAAHTAQAAVPAADREAGRPADIIYRVNELLDQKLFEATVLNQLARVGQSIEDFDTCAEMVLATLAQFLDFGLTGVCFAGSSGHAEAVVRAGEGVAAAALDEFRERMVAALPSALGAPVPDSAVTVRVCIAHDQRTPMDRLEDFRTFPLRGGNTIGLLAAAGGSQLRSEQSQFLSKLSDQVFLVLENARLYRKVRMMAVSDEQTGLFNLRHFHERLSSELARAQRYKTPVSLIMLDVDRFKRINDRYGHPVGDRVLQQIATILREQVRESDVAARYGGEEFAVILPATDLEAAVEVAERVRRGAEQAPKGEGDPPEVVTISLGVAAFPNPDLHDMDDLVKAADAALYAAKAAGRNRVCTHRPGREAVHA